MNGTGERVYLDHNATTPLRPAVRDALIRAFDAWGNPSSVHAEGRAARAAIETARGRIAAAVHGLAKDVILTSGATEALNTLLRPGPALTIGGAPAARLLLLSTEHSAVRAGGGFAPDAIGTIPVSGDGLIDLDALDALLAAAAGAALVAVQVANGETGVIQPIAAIAARVHAAGGALVVDAVAAFGKIALDINALGADALVISAHKCGGPKGVGAVILAGDRLQIAEPYLKGGGQELSRRSGTENVAGVVGMGVAVAAAADALDTETVRLGDLCARLIAGLRAHRPDLVLLGAGAPRLPNTLCVGVPRLKAETAVIAFDLAGVAISSGSACASGKVQRSHVLDAMGLGAEVPGGALRFSLGWSTTERDIDRAIAAFARIAGRRNETSEGRVAA